MAELTRRYVVMAMATEAPFDPLDPEGVFVLRPWKDPAALRALQTYRENCYPELGRDLDAWIRTIEAGPTVRGDVGRRNEPHVQAVAVVARDGAAARPRRKTKRRAEPRPARARAARARKRGRTTKRKKRSR
jgi:hypothetical protein